VTSVGDGEEKPKAEIRKLRPGAGKLVLERYIPPDAVGSRFEQLGVVYFDHGGSVPLDVMSYMREAAFCFGFARYLAAIVLASGTVETILNHDRRTKKHPRFNRVNDWAVLNNENLSIAEDEGLPISALLDSDETIKQPHPVRFVANRNKLAHGNLFGFVKEIRTFPEYYTDAANEAFQQMRKSEQFVCDWFNTAPDVQEGRIRNQRWPT
jgi:hypothetical protein